MMESSRAKISGVIALRSDLRRGAVLGDSNIKETRLRIGTLNVGSLTGRGREIVDLMERRRVNILCVQETRWKGNKARELGEGYKVYYSGADRNGRNGVGIILGKELKEEVCEVDRKNDRIISMKLMIGNCVCRVISVYAPQVGCDELTKESFWRDLDEVVMTVDSTERLYVCGDLNGHVGVRQNDEDLVHGGWAFGERNKEGDMIVQHARAFDLKIMNTCFKRSTDQLVTYKSGGKQSQIDYILSRRQHRQEIRNCKVINGESVVPQHRLLVADITVKSRGPQKQKIKYERKIKWWKLKEAQLRDEFRRRVLSELVLKEEVEDWWISNSSVIRRAGEDILGRSSGKGVPENKEAWWWNSDVQKVIKVKKIAKKNWDMTGKESDKQAYIVAKKDAKRAVAKAKAEAIEEGFKEIETQEGERKLLRIAKAKDKASKDMTVIKQMKDKEGKVLQEYGGIKRRWKEYYEALLNEENPRKFSEDGIPNAGMVKEVTEEEVRIAVRKMKNGKAVGADEIPVEAWKVLGEAGVDILCDLIRKIMKQEKMPNEWRKSILVPIYKGKGDIQECGNYRGIKLMSHTMKVWERVVESRLREETSISEEQFGFMPGRGTTDAVFAMRRMMERCREMQRETHAAFIDLEKAYDRVPRQEVWRCMRVKGVPEKYVRLVQEMYHGVKTVIRSSVGVTDGFAVQVGLHQGSVMSPYLFDMVMDVITDDIRGEAPWSMMFADDIALCAFTQENLERELENWRETLENRGLRVSRSKTEYLTTEKGEGLEIRLQDKVLPAVNKFKYLGSVIEKDGDLGGEINHRVNCGWMNWKRMSGVLCDKNVSVKLKGKLYKKVVRPALMYSAETWALTKAQERKLEVAEMKMLRWMCGITRSDRVRNERIRETVKVGPLGRKIQESRLRWFGHVERRDENYVIKKVDTIQVGGRRKRGRPKLRWKDRVEEDLREKNWRREEAQDRQLWRRRLHQCNADPK